MFHNIITIIYFTEKPIKKNKSIGLSTIAKGYAVCSSSISIIKWNKEKPKTNKIEIKNLLKILRENNWIKENIPVHKIDMNIFMLFFFTLPFFMYFLTHESIDYQLR